mgnify:CR=1 FL=1
MPLMPAKCPECGGLVEVNSENRAGLCQHCGQPFVVEDAINTFNNYFNVTNIYNTTNQTSHNYSDGTTVNVYEDTNKDFVIEAGVLKEYHGESVDVIIPDTVLEISSECFKGMNLSSIRFPKSLKHLDNVDGNLFKLKVELDSDNPYMIIKDNVILNKNETRVEAFITTDGETSFSIPNTIDSLSQTAKRQQNNISHIFYKSYDLKNPNCCETEIIEFSKKMEISFNIKHNVGEEFKCVDCKKYIVSSMPIEFFHYRHYSLYAYVIIGFINEKTAVFGNNSFHDINGIEYSRHIDEIREKLTKSQKEKFDKVKTLIILNLNENDIVPVSPDSRLEGGIQITGNALKLLFSALFSNVNKIIIEEDTTYYDCEKEKRISVIYDIIREYIWHQYHTFEEGLCLSYNDNLPSDTIEPLKKLKDEIDERVEAALKEQWRAAGKCQYCGGDLSLFGKCKICGKRN